MEPTRDYPLFGGAFSATLPPGAIDISDLRPVPDNQEVFCHRVTDQSLIVELLELQAHVGGEAAARYHFEDVGGMQKATAVQVEDVQPIPLEKLALRGCCEEAWVLSGKQQVAKENQQVAKDVTLHQALLRLPQHPTDLLLTFNQPSPDNRSSLGPDNLSLLLWNLGDFEQLVTSLTLHDPISLVPSKDAETLHHAAEDLRTPFCKGNKGLDIFPKFLPMHKHKTPLCRNKFAL